MVSLLAISACEKAEVSKSNTSPQAVIEEREVDDCTDCPVNTCCCQVALAGSTTQADLYLCGTYDPIWSDGCGPTNQGTCFEIEGEDQTISLSSPGDLSGLFCVHEESSFYIRNATGSTVSVTLTCQVGQFGAQVLNLTIPNNQADFFTADSDCVLTDCE